MPNQAGTERSRVLLVEGDGRQRSVLMRVLQGQDHIAEAAPSTQDALRELAHQAYDVVLCDVDCIGLDGLRTLASAESMAQVTQFIAMTEQKTVEKAIEATKQGAFGYITKPFAAEQLLSLVERTQREVARRRELTNQQGRRARALRTRIVGQSAALKRMLDLVERVAGTRASVLISGETGTGKELVAQAIHELSDRCAGPFVAVNCSALPETLLESELFGHVRGSFTGALANRRGLFEEASGGTLFLDEISTISPPIQVKLLRVLQDRKIHRVGGGPPIEADFRLIAATNIDLSGEVVAGRFRADLFYRLNVFPVQVPPLRERTEDIPLLVNHFRLKFSREDNLPAPAILPETMARLMSYDWPGNVRELANFIERAVIMHAGKSNVVFVPAPGERAEKQRAMLRLAQENSWDLARLEREYILDVLESQNGRRAETAALLGIDRRTLYRKLKEYGVTSPCVDDLAEQT